MSIILKLKKFSDVRLARNNPKAHLNISRSLSLYIAELEENIIINKLGLIYPADEKDFGGKIKQK